MVNVPSQTSVCVIGAGPYGVAIAAHLRHAGVDFRIFGSPIHRWIAQMPTNMLLKSEGCASGLPDPEHRFNLPQFCREQGLPFADYGSPVSREIFAEYALSFQQKFVPQVEDVMVSAVRKNNDWFEVQLMTGEALRAEHVVVATGLDNMERVPEQLFALPAELWSHSAAHDDLSKFKGKEVVVVGAGQSGLETAALLREEGVSVTLVVRATSIAWNKVPITTRRSLYQRLRRPRTQLGEGLQLWVYDNAPGIFHRLPRNVRIARVKASLGPAGAWWLKDKVMGHVPILLGHQLETAEAENGHAKLHLTGPDRQTKVVITDHVIAATGYRFDFEKLPFLDPGIKSQIEHEEQQPRLSLNFESTVQGLYFCGLASSNSFGPVMRFLAGAGFTAQRIASYIAATESSKASRFQQLRKCMES